MRNHLFILLLISLFPFWSTAQNDTTSFSQKLEKYKIKTSIGIQLWTTYSFGMEVFDSESEQYVFVDNRLNTQLRRSRFSLTGQPYRQLSFNFTASLDLVGRDLLAATEGGANNGGSPAFRIWNAFVQWRLLPHKDYLHLTAGYLVPQIGRESISSALRSTSMEKSWSQNYLRRHLTGTGPGRSMGINLGGMLSTHDPQLNLSYDIGVFNPVFPAYMKNSTGRRFSPLVVYRGVVHFGEPETKKYSLRHKINYFGQRKGVSLALSGAYQGKTDLFRRNTAIGGDWLFNYGPFNLDGEYLYLYRKSLTESKTQTFITNSRTGYLRFSYNIQQKRSQVLEPVVTYWQFRGPNTEIEQIRAQAVGSFAGRDESIDLGLNFYFNPNLKISLHHTWRWGDAGEGGDGVLFNNYFYQAGVGAIRRGNWLGIGFIGIF